MKSKVRSATYCVHLVFHAQRGVVHNPKILCSSIWRYQTTIDGDMDVCRHITALVQYIHTGIIYRCTLRFYQNTLCPVAWPFNMKCIIHFNVWARWPSGLERWLGLAIGRFRPVFESHYGKLRFGTLAIPFTPLCHCLSEETLEAVGPFYLVSMPGEVKYPTSPYWNV